MNVPGTRCYVVNWGSAAVFWSEDEAIRFFESAGFPADGFVRLSAQPRDGRRRPKVLAERFSTWIAHRYY